MFKKIIGSIALAVIVLFIGAAILDWFVDIYAIVGWWTLIVTPISMVAVVFTIIWLVEMASWVFKK